MWNRDSGRLGSPSRPDLFLPRHHPSQAPPHPGTTPNAWANCRQIDCGQADCAKDETASTTGSDGRDSSVPLGACTRDRLRKDHPFMPIYTGTGDAGQTGLFGNRRVPKDDVRITAYGTIDELNSVLGLLGAELDEAEHTKANASAPTRSQVKSIQDALFEVGADLATEGGKASVPRVKKAVAELESWIDASEEQLPQLKTFVLPGGGKIASLLHVARTVTRRAERCYWTLCREVAATHPVPEVIGIYLNRLSDLCFSWARLANQAAGIDDVPWTR
tara:strand:- start:118150 stop:118977 length:828 start_codon:yes stop_codon:yes gene_type:complete